MSTLDDLINDPSTDGTPFFMQCGLKTAAHFLKQPQRLSGIVSRQPDEIVR